ncbi:MULTISPECIES: phosphatase PAP2 family protein [unclassified Kitasatospora]|uniref:phosphatase PAP2 family protein n=1 Tax=unclassified Kitasatospora TaxID=2633591 RepID=UPI00247526CD|nr:phosphatase PAP2 family protein [Kitasatospora sp. MAP12-44]
MESEHRPPTGHQATAGDIQDNQAPLAVTPPKDRSTDRPAHTPRGARNGDHPSRPGALPPAPGRLTAALTSALASAAMPVVLLVLLVAVSWQVAVDGPLLTLDQHIRSAVTHARQALDSSLVNGLAHLLSDLGDSTVAVPVLLGAGVLTAWRLRRRLRSHVHLHQNAADRRWWLPLPTAALAALLIPLLVIPAKAYFARPGPLGQPVIPGQWGWYPSGHTSTACIAYGAGALLLGRTLAAAARRALYAATAVLGLGVGLGLIWCDYHWFLDVLAGWCLSGLVLGALARRLPRPR